MYYIVAIVVAGLVIAGAAWFVRHTKRSLKQRARAAIKEGQAAGRLPPDIDAEQIDLAGCDMELPASEMFRVQIAYALAAWRFVLAPAVLLGSLAIARLLDHLRR